MTSWTLTVAALTTATLTTAAQPFHDSARELAEIHREFRHLQQQTAKAESDEARSRNIVGLCRLFVEIGEHPDLASSPTLQSLSVRLRSRLSGIERRTVAELRKRKIPEPVHMIASRRAYQMSRASRRSSPLRSAAQPSYKESGLPLASGSLRMQGQGTSKGSAGPGGLPDYGWTLVDLIRKTIRPEYWSVAGGPGKAIYYGQSRALVIHGSWRVQEEVAELLSALRGGP